MKKILAILGAAIVAVLTVLWIVYPRALAFACPQCVGFSRVTDRLYMEQDAPSLRISHARLNFTTGIDRVGYFFGSQEAPLRILVCNSDACYRRFSNDRVSPLAERYGDGLTIISPRGNTPAVFAHEMVEAELLYRLGGAADDTPIWFIQGLATFVAGDPRYVKAPGQGDRCMGDASINLPAAHDEWPAIASANRELYAGAACRVGRWMESHEGAKGVLALIARMRDGAPFDSAYGVN